MSGLASRTCSVLSISNRECRSRRWARNVSITHRVPVCGMPSACETLARPDRTLRPAPGRRRLRRQGMRWRLRT